MAVSIPRKAAFFWNSKWLRMSSYSVLPCSALQHEYRKLICATMAGSKDASPSSVRRRCECPDIIARVSLCTHHAFLYNMVNHMRAHSTDAKANMQSCPCGKFTSDKGFLICPVCNTVQAPNPATTYFQIFDEDEKFELDLKDLEVKYKRLMKKLHPDLSHGKSREEKENYAQLSALVTTAYTELLKPVSRATYMLKLRGIHVEEEGTVTDSELIMEVMEIRETLQSSPDRKTLEQLHKTAMTRMSEWSEAFKSALKGGDDMKAVGALQRMSYFGRVCEDINRELL